METKEKIIKYSLLVSVLAVLVLGGSLIKNTWFVKDLSGTIKIVESLDENTIATTTIEAKTEQAKVSQDKSAGCENSSYDFDCYYYFYNDLVKKKGLAAAFTDIKNRYEKNSYVRSQCHPLTHVIGRATAKLYPKVSDAYKYGDPLCWSGFYHGVMEEIVGEIGIDKIKNDMDGICDGIPGKERYSFDYYNCVHGLGHGLMAITENELFESLNYCDYLTGGWEKTSCYGGVFMENVIVDNKNHFTKYLKPKEPLYPCSAVGQNYKNVCYLMQTSYMLKVTNNDFKKVFDLCRTADAGHELACFQSLGRDASGQSLSNADATWAKCSLGEGYEEQSNCIVGAVKDFISFYHSDREVNVLCAIVSSDLQKICLETASSYYKSL
ncbi:MAG: hypothetical protein AB198_00440 [Parcubacteria bacterium C7867-003]|nr:MAG: hypothetical protein AB198_00440 [Parcubacteria bacterium C7867-003]